MRELGYSDAAAWRRIKAMRLCADFDGVRERLQDGSMTLNAAAQLQNAFDRQERNRDRAARSAPGGSGFGDAAQSQDGSAPGPAQPAERKPAPALDRSARRALVEQAAGKSSRQVRSWGGWCRKGSTATTRPGRRAGGAPALARPARQAPSRLRRRR